MLAPTRAIFFAPSCFITSPARLRVRVLRVGRHRVPPREHVRVDAPFLLTEVPACHGDLLVVEVLRAAVGGVRDLDDPEDVLFLDELLRGGQVAGLVRLVVLGDELDRAIAQLARTVRLVDARLDPLLDARREGLRLRAARDRDHASLDRVAGDPVALLAGRRLLDRLELREVGVRFPARRRRRRRSRCRQRVRRRPTQRRDDDLSCFPPFELSPGVERGGAFRTRHPDASVRRTRSRRWSSRSTRSVRWIWPVAAVRGSSSTASTRRGCLNRARRLSQ